MQAYDLRLQAPDTYKNITDGWNDTNILQDECPLIKNTGSNPVTSKNFGDILYLFKGNEWMNEWMNE